MQRRVPTIHDLKVKLCYICREEERHDAPEPRVWTHPCSCTLIAHEACLLRWIQSAQSTRRAPNALKCPQCGTAYELTSSNPWLLRTLNIANKGLSIAGRIVSIGSLTVVVVSLGTGLYILGTAYGAYAVREFLGAEMFDVLLTDDPSNWPWHSFINLPLIPLALIFSRLPLKTNVTPLIPLLLAWPTSAPVVGTDPPPPSLSRKDLFTLLPLWPPPPFVLGLFLFPIVREGYRRFLAQVSRWVLSTEHAPQRPSIGGPADEEPFLRIRVNARIDEDERPAARADNANANDPDPNDDDDDNADAAAAAAENTIRVSGTSLGRLIGGALITPRISSLMGSLLFWLAKHSAVLRAFLAVRLPMARAVLGPWAWAPFGGGAWGPRAVWGGRTLGEMGLLKKLGVASMLGLSVAWRGTLAWTACDPVWWRNALGLGLFTMAKDGVHLVHLYLTKRELESRRVRNRSFEGVDVRELDLIDPEVYV